MRNKNWLKSSWTVSLGTTVFSLILTMVYDYIKNKPVLSTVLTIFMKLWNFIILILNYRIKVWWLIVGISILIAVVYAISNFKHEIVKPDFCNYTNGVLKSWRWSWDWHFNISKNAWNISDLTAHCPRCDTPLIDSCTYYRQKFECPRCNYHAIDSKCEEPYKIERLILDNVNRKRN